ncbi:MAG TPA: glycosyltransferase [Solirubrobacteraceae bacterium]|jgi:spore maturation protein CgeB|nr:glycosyltransferase [Solirubrobacteraceae bacterium]
MKVVIFSHSLLSDWNHGNAHFLRGVVAELLDRGHEVVGYEPREGWSRVNLVADAGIEPLIDVRERFGWMDDVVCDYDLATLDLDRALDGAQLVIVHEWNPPELVARIGERRAATGGAGFRLLFHDTHHRAVSAPDEMARFDLRHYDGVLAFGALIRDVYLERGWCERAWTLHEAADARVFRPLAANGRRRDDLVWIGNWGDGERSEELREFLLGPARRAPLRGAVHGVRYPRRARIAIRLSGLRYRGWLANHRAPEVFAQHRVTVHVPRRPYVEALPGIPTIRPFEALACGIPLVSAPWEDSEGLFRAGEDYLVARDGAEMTRLLRDVLHEPGLAVTLRTNGLQRIAERHTCAHRVDELLEICRSLGVGGMVAA